MEAGQGRGFGRRGRGSLNSAAEQIRGGALGENEGVALDMAWLWTWRGVD